MFSRLTLNRLAVPFIDQQSMGESKVFSKDYYEQSGLVTFREAAALTGIAEDTIRRWKDRDHLPIGLKSRGRLYVYLRDVLQLVAQRMPAVLK